MSRAPGQSEIEQDILDGVVGPTLLVLSRPVLDDRAVEQFLSQESTSWHRTDSATDAESLVELAGRVCYLSFGTRQSPKSNEQYLAHLVQQGHESVLEHACWTFILTGVSRAFSHQIVRHRIGFSYSQLSQQYHDESDAPVVMPRIVRRNPAAARLWQAATSQSQATYRDLVAVLRSSDEVGPTREHLRRLRSAVRSVLTAATETKLVFSANARALRHFLTVRGDLEGDEEMRLVSALLLRTLQDEAPALFHDFRVEVHDDGLPIVRRYEGGAPE